MGNERNHLPLDVIVSVGNMNQTANLDLGVEQEYDRSNYDNPYAHRKFKDKAFENKQGDINKTAIDENGKLVYRYKDDAKARFGNQKGELAVSKTFLLSMTKTLPLCRHPRFIVWYALYSMFNITYPLNY